MTDEFFLDWELSNGAKGTVQVKGGVVDNPEPAAEALVLIGHANIAWSRFENHLNFFLIALNQKGGQASALGIYKDRHPTPFADKIRMLKTHTRRHPKLVPHAYILEQIVSLAPAIADFRNMLIHSSINSYNPDSKMIQVTHYQVSDKVLYARTYTLPLDALVMHCRDINRFNEALLSVTREIMVPSNHGQL